MSVQVQSAPAVGVIDENNLLTLNWQPFPGPDGLFDQYTGWEIRTKAGVAAAVTTTKGAALNPGETDSSRIFTLPLISSEYKMNMRALASGGSPVAADSDWWTPPTNDQDNGLRAFPSVLGPSSVTLDNTTVLLGQPLQVTLNPAYTGADQWQVIWPDTSSTGWLPLTASIVSKQFSTPGAQVVVVQTRRSYSSSLYNPPATLIRQLSIQIFVMDQQAATSATGNTGLSSTLGFAGTEGFEIINASAAQVAPEPWEVIARGIVRDTVTNELKLLIATSRFQNASSLYGTMAVDVFPIEGRPHVKELLTPVFEIITNANTTSVPVRIQTSTFPDMIVGKSVAEALGGDFPMAVKDSTGIPNFIWNATGLPAGLVMGSNGVISGVPLEMGFFEVTFSVMDSGTPFSIDEVTLSLLIKTDLQVKKHNQPATDTNLGTATVGTPYSQQMDVGNIIGTSPLPGGLPPYKWSLPAGSLPIGLSIDADSGLISGTPCTYNSTTDFTKTFSVVIQVTDAIGAKASNTFSMLLAPAALQFGPLDQPTIFAGQQFKLVVPVFGGKAPYTLTSQTNDAGATPALIDGQIQTTLEYGPSATGTHTIFFEITDAAATIVQKAFSYKVGVQISSVRWEKGFVDHIWADTEATSSTPIPIPADADFSGLALDSFSELGSNTGLTITVDNVYKTAPITNIVAASGTYTVTAVNTLIAGDNVYLTGLSGAYAALNLTTQVVLASGLSSSQFKFTTGVATTGSLAQTATAQKLQNFVISGPKSPSLFVYDDYSRVPIILKSGGIEVARISRAYTLLAHDIAAFSPGDVGIVNNLTHPYIVGDTVGLNPRTPFFNSPDLAALNSLWTVRVKAGSALLPGLSLDSVTGLVYGKLLGTVVGLQSVLEYVDATGTLHGTLTLSWSIAVPQTQTTSTFVDGLLGTSYTPVGFPGVALGPLGIVLAPSQTTLTSVAVYSGTLPTGLSFALDSVNNRGVVTGAPTEAGYFDVWLQVTGDTKSAFVYQRVAVDYLKPLSILNTDLPTISAQAYSVTLQGFGGAPPYTGSLTTPPTTGDGGWQSAQFPGGVGAGNFAGLTLTSNPDGTGTLAGTLTSPPGSSPFDLGNITFELADQRGVTAAVFKILDLVYNNRLRILTPLNGIASINPDASDYAFAMQAAGGVPPYSWELDTPGSPQSLLPTGISFETENAPSPYDATAGQFSGATNDTGYGSSSFTITVKDSSILHTGDSANASGSFLVVVATPVLTIDDSLAGPIPRGEVYLGTLTLVGPAGFPATWQVSPVPSFPLNLPGFPTGLSLHANGLDNGLTAAITGTYSGAPFSNYRVRVVAVDSTGQTAVKVLSLNSGTNLTITTTSLPNPTEPSGSYSFQMTKTGGVDPVTWTWDQAPTFHGLSISSSGLISGTANALFSQAILFTVTDSLSNVATKTLTLTSQPVGLAITTPPATATSGRSYSFQMLATGGTPSYSWSISGGALPSGLSMSSSGLITGTTTQVGAVPVTFRVTDFTAAFTDATFTFTVINGLTLVAGIDDVDGTSLDIIGYIVHGQPDSLTRPNHSFYVIATGVVSTSIGQITNVNAGPGPAGGFNAVISALDVATGRAAISLTGSGWGAAPIGSNSIVISLTDSGTSIAKTFTWVVYDDGTLRLAPTSGSLPIQSVQ